jgi:predicted small secreted protein
MTNTLRFGAACCVLLFTLSACNTVAGLGRDVERAGEKVQEVAKKK